MANNDYGPSIVLFPNTDRQTGQPITDPKKPSMTGKLEGLNAPEILAALQAGEDLRIAVWTKESKNGGKRFLSGAVSVFEKKDDAPQQQAPAAPAPDLPF